MARACSVCSHSDAVLINELLVIERQSNRAIARQYSLHHDAIRRHREHIPRLLVKAAEAEQIAQADDLVHEMKTMISRVRAFIDKAEEADDGPEFRAHAAEWRKQVELLAKIVGELQQEGTATVNIGITAHPDYRRLSDAIAAALDAYPQAGYAVAAALEEIEGGRG
jgi:hypothetical protein